MLTVETSKNGSYCITCLTKGYSYELHVFQNHLIPYWLSLSQFCFQNYVVVLYIYLQHHCRHTRIHGYHWNVI